MQRQQHRRILAIDPGTRLMGVAFLDDGKLIYHAVKVIAKGRSPQQTLQRARDAVLRLIDDLAPQVIAVERTFFSNNRNAALLNVLFDEIRSVARRKGLDFVSYAPSTIKKFTCGNGWAEKREVATVIVTRFPELKVYLTQDRAWKERFHQNMFDAVALGVMAMDFGAPRKRSETLKPAAAQ
jgi:Holliday junction resolvasome RuvABC endonuclease subunit